MIKKFIKGVIAEYVKEENTKSAPSAEDSMSPEWEIKQLKHQVNTLEEKIGALCQYQKVFITPVFNPKKFEVKPILTNSAMGQVSTTGGLSAAA